MFSSTKTTKWTVLFSLLTALSSQAQTTSSAAAVPTVQSTVAAAGSSVVSAVSGIATSASSAAVAPVQGTATIDTAGLPTAQVATSLPYSYSVPNLASITANMPVATTVPLESTFPAGAQPTFVSSAPPLPSSALVIADYPALDRVPPTNSTQVQQWLSELDLSDVPNYGQTTGACLTSPDAVADKNRCWWTCGGCTRSTDITVCPDKLDWGLSYDDGPSPYTPLLLDYLNANDIKTTFFVVGSRVLSRPEMVVSEYMSGHQISVHTWSHPYLTNLTNEEIVAELGWTKKVIKDTIGVTPRTFRPPYGDIDDRVRSIAAKMGLTPIIWTTANGVIFDTDDWNIPGGTATGATSLARFEQILSTAEQIDTGFIVLEHDLYQQTVDLAVGYVLPMALNASSPYHLKSISQCLGWEDSEGYIETSSNDTVVSNPAAASGTSFPVVYNTGSAAAPAATGSSANTAPAGTSGGSAASTGGSTTASSAPGTSSSGATGAAVKDLGIAPGLKAVVALGAVALGAVLIL